MWRYSIYAFLEILQYRLPESLEHILAFIYITYSIIALLYKTIPTFEDMQIKYLGDLGRYRIAIEDDEPKDREVWSGVAKDWYSKASNKSPTVSRLYHHLAILIKPYILTQLLYYTKCLIYITPFESTRGSIITLLNPILAGRTSLYYWVSLIETLGIKAYRILFIYPQRLFADFRLVLQQLKEFAIAKLLNNFEHNSYKIKKVGAFFAVSNNAAIFKYGVSTEKGKPRSVLR